jgi:hypothetical protein
MPDEPQPTHPLLKGLMIVALCVAGFFIIRAVMSGNNSLSGKDCSTNLEYNVPKEQFKGVEVSMAAARCSDVSDTTGRSKPYVLVTLQVKGKTSDGSKVRSLPRKIRLDRKPKGSSRWERGIRPTDVPKDTGVSTSGSEVAYESQQRWDMRKMPTRVVITVLMSTDKSNPVRARHTFSLP